MNKDKYRFTNECRKVFSHMKNEIIQMYPGNKITGEHFMLSVGECKNSEAYQILSQLMFSESMDALWGWCIEKIQSSVYTPSITMTYDELFDKCLIDSSNGNSIISSGRFLCELLKNDNELSRKLSVLGVTHNQIEHEILMNENAPNSDDTISQKNAESRKKVLKQSKKNIKKADKHLYENGELDKYLININKIASEGNVDEVIGNENVIDSILSCLLKRDRNNAILVGDVGSGKTSTIMHIANKIIDGSINNAFFEGKQMMKMDFMSLVSGTGFRGGFESKYENIIELLKKAGNCILFIDDIHSILGQNSKFSEISTDTMLDKLLSDKRIPCICATTYEGYYKTISSNETLNNRFEKIEMPKYGKDEITVIVNKAKEKYEHYHNITIPDTFIKNAVNYCERFLPNYGIDTVLEIVDKSASLMRMEMKPDFKLSKLKDELEEIENKISLADSSSDIGEYGDYDKLVKEKLTKKTEIEERKKQLNTTCKKPVITENYLLMSLSQKTGLTVGDMTKDEVEKLSNLPQKIKESIVGQDEAVDIVCSAVKRHRSGLSDRTKPQVFMFVGRTGCGKTYLAKKISEELYGSENNIVRLDMSEYSDKISVNKLTGASSGYVGYDDGGVLTEAVKRNKHCVVLLDEIEKADNSVFDVFLQVFDEGRLTDNKGVTVDFSDTIIIMTSNIGMREIEDKGLQVGFNKNEDNNYDKSVILKSMKRRFKPEFLNRITDVVFFNPLTDDNIKEIIKMELKKLEKRVENAGYKLSNDVYTGTVFDSIFDKVITDKEYGARPVIRAIENIVEDKLADLIIDKKIKKGHKFTNEELSK